MEVALSAIAVITLVGNVSSICFRLYGSLGTREELNQIVKELDGLRYVLTTIAQLTESDKGSTQAGSKSPLAKLIKDCQSEVKALEIELKKIETSRVPGLTLPWLLKEKELARQLERLSRVRQNLQLSMQSDQAAMQLHAQREDEAFRASFTEQQSDQYRRRIMDWLGPGSFSPACHDAQKVRSTNTCTWLLESTHITAWRLEAQSRVWLHGIPGCGKTVFASSVVETLTAHCHKNRSQLLVYYFFEFASRDKGTTSSFLCAMLSQIVAQKKVVHNAVQTLYHESYEGARKPSDKALLDALREVMEESQHVYMIVDAIDECSNQAEMLEVLRKVVLWNLPSLHLMVTSRSGKAFEESFSGFRQISLTGKEHNEDIQRYIRQRLLEEREWQKWPAEVQQQITAVVVDKAEDMFRLAKLHLDRLQRSKNKQALQQNMQELPLTLYDTYDRILSNIASEDRQDALRVLSWLCFAMRPPTLSELAAALAVNLESLEYDQMQVYQNADDILGICSSFLKYSEEDGRHVVKLSHASVKDYLTSGRVLTGEFQELSSGSTWANRQICAVCLVYLTAHNYENKEQALDSYSNNPLVSYATGFWSEHFRRAGEDAILLELARELLIGQSLRYIRWAWIGAFTPRGFHVEQPVDGLDNDQTRLNTVLYLTAFIGNTYLIDAVLHMGAEVNGVCGAFDTPLAAATFMGNFEAAKRLLQVGADANAKAGPYGNVLQLASSYGHIDLVDILLTSGADVQAQGGIFHTALYAATNSPSRATEVAARLIRAGADLSVGMSHYTPLINAVENDDRALVQLFLDSKANVNDGSLQGALRKGNLDMAQMLIDAGATLEFVDAVQGTVLGSATVHGVKTLQFLVEELGMNIHSLDKEGRNALHVAASTGNVEVVRYLLALGLQVSSKDSKGWSAVHYAATARTPDCLRLLLPEWTVDTSGWTPLHLACRANQPEAIDLLLEAGLRATSIATEQPPRRWTLFDIVAWHCNLNLISAEGEVSHRVLQQDEEPPNPEDFGMGLVPYRSWRFCDGCQPAQEKQTMFTPLFRCRECPDYDYCMVCMTTAAITHEHSAWELLPDSQTEKDYLVVEYRNEYQPTPLHHDPLRDKSRAWTGLL